MQTGVYSAQKKDGTVYYRANITYQTKHISLGSFSSEEDAHSAYLEACNLLENEAVTLFNIHSQIRHLSFDKAVCLLNFRDNHLYFHNPIYLRKGYFSYFLSDDMELKFDIDDLFYYAGHRIQKRQGHLFVSDYGMQYSILSRYGIKPYAVTGRDYLFFNGDTHDFRYSNILNINRYHGVFSYEKNGATHYKVFIHINGNYKIGSYASEACRSCKNIRCDKAVPGELCRHAESKRICRTLHPRKNLKKIYRLSENIRLTAMPEISLQPPRNIQKDRHTNLIVYATVLLLLIVF